MYIVVGHHRSNDQGIAVGVMDEVCLTIFEDDVVIFPLELSSWPLIQVMDISGQPISCFSDVAVLGPICLPSKMRFVEDHPNLVWGLRFYSVILLSCPPVIDIILKVPTTDELLYFIFEGNALLSDVTNDFVEPAVFILVPFEAFST